MTIRRRVEKLEEAQGSGGDPGEAPPIVIYWPEDETPETRAAYRAACKWYKDHKQPWPEKVVLTWADGSEAGPP